MSDRSLIENNAHRLQNLARIKVLFVLGAGADVLPDWTLKEIRSSHELIERLEQSACPIMVPSEGLRRWLWSWDPMDDQTWVLVADRLWPGWRTPPDSSRQIS